MSTKYQHIFFDLDHTLWDFETNSRETLTELFADFKLDSHGIAGFEEFMTSYKIVNDQKWELYRQGGITKDELRVSRFYDTLMKFDINHPELAADIDKEYIYRSPQKTNLFPNAIETLEYLGEKYKMHIITNGFTEVQDVKLTKSGLKPFFKHRITSEIAGVNKPDPGIFRFALKETGAKRKDSIMIGDNLLADCIGARRSGIDQVYFNPDKNPHEEKLTFEIANLSELVSFL